MKNYIKEDLPIEGNLVIEKKRIQTELSEIINESLNNFFG